MAQYKGAAREGQRAAHLMKKREKQKEELELLKKKIADVCYKIYFPLSNQHAVFYMQKNNIKIGF